MTATALDQSFHRSPFQLNHLLPTRDKAFMRALPDCGLLLPAADLVMPVSNVALDRLMHIKIMNHPDQAWLLLLLLRLVHRE